MRHVPVIVRETALQAACLFLLLFFASCASIPVHISPEGRRIPEDFAGIVHAARTGTDTEIQQLKYLGAKWTIHSFDWHRIEAVQGEWDFSMYDKIVDNCKDAGLKIIAVLAYDVPWIHEEGHRKRYIPPDKLPDFLLYVRKTVEHFRGRVDAWNIWNEPNFFFWKGTDDEFIELSRQAADAVRDVDSKVTLFAGAFNRFVFFPEKFIRKFFESGAMKKVDYIAFHPYDTSIARSVRAYERFREVVDEYGFGDKIRITEIGFPTGGVFPNRIPLKKFPESVIKIYAHLAYAGALNVLWYQLYDPLIREYRGSIRSSEDYFGLIRSIADPTSKASEAFRLSALNMPNTTCYVLTPEQDGIPRSVKAFWFKGANGGALVIWKDGGGASRLNIRLPGTEHLRHDIVTGNKDAIPAEITIRAGSEPVFITWHGSFNSGSAEGRPVIKK